MKISLMVTTYNWKEALEMVLLSAFRQTVPPFEIIVADDGSTEDTRELIDRMRETTDIPLHHVWHPDEGHRRTVILNKGIAKAQGDYVSQADGDVILHRNFIQDQQRFAEPGVFLRGYRVMLDEETSRKALDSKILKFSPFVKGLLRFSNAIRSPFLTRLTLGDAPEWRRVFGSNLSYWREDALTVNGYNEDILGWGPEDTEFVARLIFNGINRRKLKFAAKQHHLYHPDISRDKYDGNMDILKHTLENKLCTCANGINKLL
ncbi:MAG TPA: glycosyltransferase [Candidatus Hydrogenedentes bacterium]|nr:glycosyltransferase [Candidatus Hydrogenedentota bacterium]HIB54298.1 glycosyltransferase [Nitrospirales bacterium]